MIASARNAARLNRAQPPPPSAGAALRPLNLLSGLFVFVGLVVAMMFGMQLAGFGGVVRGVLVMALRDMGVVAGGHMIVVVMVIGGFAMMVGGQLVMLGGLAVMVCDLGFGHGENPPGGERAVRAGSIRTDGDRSAPFR